MKTVADFYKAANGARVRKTVSGAPTLAEWESKRRAVVERIKAAGGTDIKAGGTGFTYTTAAGWPSYEAGPAPELSEAFGIFRVLSKEYTFTADGGGTFYAQKTGAKIDGDTLVKDYGGGRVIRFEVLS